jgi:hypothetical protein
MAYIQQDGFNFLAGLNGEPESFVLTGKYIEDEIKYLIENKINSIYLNQFDSKEIQNLDFLKKTPFVKQINIDGLDVQ